MYGRMEIRIREKRAEEVSASASGFGATEAAFLSHSSKKKEKKFFCFHQRRCRHRLRRRLRLQQEKKEPRGRDVGLEEGRDVDDESTASDASNDASIKTRFVSKVFGRK